MIERRKYPFAVTSVLKRNEWLLNLCGVHNRLYDLPEIERENILAQREEEQQRVNDQYNLADLYSKTVGAPAPAMEADDEDGDGEEDEEEDMDIDMDVESEDEDEDLGRGAASEWRDD